ncbi:MAG TPA: Gfo/Idh/MocA family oxidoreductase [Candidatus Deferrimicrobium sp.]|nr:Gfo/Idh/MocA family oxidoreductase [Candidatus Deferrimicrobium sp.]
MGKKKTAVIGAGWFGRAHCRVYNAISDLVAIADTDEERAKGVADSYHINYYLDYEEMIKKEKLDAVSIVLPPRVAPLIAVDLAKNGTNILLEKPLGTSLADVQPLLKYTSDVRITCGFIERFNPVVDQLKKRLPEIGIPIMISSKRIGRYPKRFWNLGVLLDLGIHEIDIQRYLFGDITEVKSTLSYFHKEDYEDAAFILLQFSKNIQGLIEVNWLTPTKYRKASVYGSEGVMEIDYSTQELKVIRSSEEPALYRIEESIQPYSWEEPLQRELSAFLYNKENPIPLEEGIKSLEIALNCLNAK